MYKDLISNIAIMISCLAISGQLFRMKQMDANLKTKLLGGLVAGLLGSLLMMFSVKMPDNILIDFRNFAIIIVSLYGGLTSGLAASAIIIMNRFIFFGVNPSAIAAGLILLALTISASYLKTRNYSAFAKFFIANILNIVLFSIAIAFLIKDTETWKTLFVSYGTFCLLGGFPAAWLADYIVRSNQNYQQLHQNASTDFLTGLNNVRQFDDIWNRKVLAAKQTDTPLSLLIIDIDHFKHINDKYGHPIGDQILRQLGGILARIAGNRGIAARNGGEEFSIILPNTKALLAKETAEEVRKAVENHLFTISTGASIKITVSVGVASYPETTTDIDQLIKKADDSLYRAKNQGRNCVCA